MKISARNVDTYSQRIRKEFLPDMNKVKVYLDDERKAPEGWQSVKSAEMAISLMKKGVVDEISLDHDLGRKKTGYDVLLWVEQEMRKGFIPPVIHIHTANPVGRMKMELALDSIYKYLQN